MRVSRASGDTPLAAAAQEHETAGRARTCCEEHARADGAFLRFPPGAGDEEPRFAAAPLTPNTLVLEPRHFAELLGVRMTAFWDAARTDPAFPKARARRGAGRKRVYLRSEAEEYIRNLPIFQATGAGSAKDAQ